MRTHADDVLEITVSLLRAMTHAGTYDPAHPNYERARPKLHKDLVRLLRVQPEIAFVTAPPQAAGGPRELHVDGTTNSRVDIRRIIPPSMGGAFALQLLQGMQQRDVVMLAFRRAIEVEELLGFFDLWAEGFDGETLDRALRENRVRNIVVLTSRDLVADDAPWPVRVALSRLTHDLLACEGDWAPSFSEVCEELSADAVRPFLRQGDVLFSILANAPKTRARLARDPDLRGVSARDLLLEGMPRMGLYTMVATGVRAAGDDEGRREILRLCGERLVKDEESPERDRALAELRDKGLLSLDYLPTEEQEWLYAKRWAEDTDPDSEPAPVSTGILTKAARLAIGGGRYGEADVALVVLETMDPAKTVEIFDAETIQTIVRNLPDDAGRREQVVALFHRAGDAVIEMLAEILTRLQGKAAQNAAYVITQLGPAGTAAVGRVQQRRIDQENSAKRLLSRG